jgi:uncharacterized protein YjiK
MKTGRIVLALGTLAALAYALHLSALIPLGYHWLQAHVIHADTRGMGLRSYRVDIDARPLDGIAENASGLTFHPTRGTLFTVVNKPPQVAELDLTGRVLRRFPLKGMSDVEGISHQAGDYFVIADEKQQQIVRIHIPDSLRDREVIDTTDSPRFGLRIDAARNRGYEGVSWDSKHKRLLIVKEKQPLRVFEISGLADIFEGRFTNLDINEWQPEASQLLLGDLSSISYHEPSEHLFLLSHESHLLLEYNAQGEPVDLLVLRAGWHGLAKTIPQAEGMTIGPDGTVYVLSEPNLFYRFVPTVKP